MRAACVLAIALVCPAWAVPATAETRMSNECLDVVSKYLNAMGGMLKEAKPSGACALANWAKNRFEELSRGYNAEPEECRKTDLGKNVEKTLKVRLRQETNMSKRHCRRK
jgi:hypothetical protein